MYSALAASVAAVAVAAATVAAAAAAASVAAAAAAAAATADASCHILQLSNIVYTLLYRFGIIERNEWIRPLTAR